MIIQAAVIRSNLKKSMQILLKNCLEFLATPTSTTTDAMALKFLQTLSSDYKANSSKGFVNQIKIDRIVSNDLSTCNMHQFKIISNFHFDY